MYGIAYITVDSECVSLVERHRYLSIVCTFEQGHHVALSIYALFEFDLSVPFAGFEGKEKGGVCHGVVIGEVIKNCHLLRVSV